MVANQLPGVTVVAEAGMISGANQRAFGMKIPDELRQVLEAIDRDN